MPCNNFEILWSLALQLTTYSTLLAIFMAQLIELGTMHHMSLKCRLLHFLLSEIQASTVGEIIYLDKKYK